MHDRIPSPGKEGRVLITPEDGSTPFYATIAMADDPLQEGTELSSTTLLKELTASIYGLGREAVPDDVFAALSPLAMYHWKRRQYWEENSPYRAETNQTITLYSTYNTDATPETIEYCDDLDVDEDKNLVAVNLQSAATEATEASMNTIGALIKGKYVLYESNYYYVGSFAVVADSNDVRLQVTAYLMTVESHLEYGAVWEPLSSTDPDAYPPGFAEDGYFYVAFGKAMENAMFTGLRIETGSYLGGTDLDAVTVDMGFRPSLLVIQGGYSEVSSWLVSANHLLIAFGDHYITIPYEAPTRSHKGELMTDTGFFIPDVSTNKTGMNAAGVRFYWWAIGIG